MARRAVSLVLADEQRAALSELERADGTPQALAFRARLILRYEELGEVRRVAQEEKTSRPTVILWRDRFLASGIDGLKDKARTGRPPSLPAAKIDTVLSGVVQPPAGRTRWSIRTMARHAGVSKSRVQALWSQNDLKPHLTRTFKLSNDPQFEPKFWDVIGLYLQPPQKALVLCCDEKSQCQALERSQPGLPLGIGHIRTRTHDYTRHGTVTLFAALDYLEGKIFSATAPKHTHVEWLEFLKQIDRETPPDLALHLIVDNYATHKHALVKAWLAKHPRFHLHFTPTGSSWLNLVERFFRDLTVDVVRDGSFRSVRELTHAIETYLAERNLAPKPYRWRADGASILKKIHAARSASKSKDINRSAH
jgi:transposase